MIYDKVDYWFTNANGKQVPVVKRNSYSAYKNTGIYTPSSLSEAEQFYADYGFNQLPKYINKYESKAMVDAYFAAHAYEGGGTVDKSYDFINNDTTKGTYVSMDQLRAFGWADMSVQELNNMNEILKEFGITDPASIAFFLATCAVESGYGRLTLEEGDDAYFATKTYEKHERGVGYSQLSLRKAQLEFLGAMESDYDGANTAEYIAANYDPWVVAAYVWADMKFGDKRKMNEYVVEKGEHLKRFWPRSISLTDLPKGSICGSDLTGIVNYGYTYYIDIENNELLVNGHHYTLPNGWEDRKKAYDNAIIIFN